MKKLLFVLVCVFFTATSFASDKLSGVISDSRNPAKLLSGVKIILDGNDKILPSDEDGIYTIPNFTPEADKILEFKLDKYEPLSGSIIREVRGSEGKKVITGLKVGKKTLHITPKVVDKKWDKETLELNVTLVPEKEPIISGTIRNEKNEEIKGVKVTAFGVNDFEETATTDDLGFYTIKGYWGTDANPAKYKLKFSHNKYDTKNVVLDNIEVKTAIVPDQDVKLEKINVQAEIESNMVAMTGFGCDELMPKYLIGASCQQNKELKGDATDLAMWIQKFGGKITALMGIIAVVLIVWNAFTLTTAAGDADKISQGKRGIMWTILGLAVAMFAYLVVKTVIVLMFTQ